MVVGISIWSIRVVLYVMQGSIGTRDIVVVPPAYPVDGRPATVQLVSLAAARAADPAAAELVHSPGPLIKGEYRTLIIYLPTDLTS